MPTDSFFTFSLRAEQINQALYNAMWTYTSGSNLTIRNLAGGGPPGTRGINASNYTDNACNTANIDLNTYIAAYQATSSVPSPYHTTQYLRFTNPGPPVPGIYKQISSPFGEAVGSVEFHGTCKPVSLGDYVNHQSQNAVMGAASGFDRHFVTAGYDPALGKICVNINELFEVSEISMGVNNVGSIIAGTFPSGVNGTSKIRLFTHPSWTSGAFQYILLIGWDNATSIYLEKFNWDGSNLNSVGSSTISTTNGMLYTGQHDIHYTNSGNILLQTWDVSRTVGTVYEISASTLTTLNSVVSQFVAYDSNFDVIGVRRTNNFETYSGALSVLPVSSVTAFSNGSRAYDAIWHPDEPGVIYVGEQISSSTITSHAFFYNSTGSVSSNTNRGQNLPNSVAFNQVERTSQNVLVSFAGPNSSIPMTRSVCAGTIYRGGTTTIDYTDNITPGISAEDITQMRHPKAQDYTRVNDTNSDSTIGGNSHIISANYNLSIGGWGQNYTTKHWNFEASSAPPMSSHHMYILYLGYYQDHSNIDTYAYIAVSGINFDFIKGSTLPPLNVGGLNWIKFRTTY